MINSFLFIGAASCLVQAQEVKNTSHITVKDSNDKHIFIASYSAGRQREVVKYLNEFLQPSVAFEPDKSAHINLIPADKRSPNIEVASGNIRITWNKNENLPDVITRIHKLEDGITSIIKPNTE
jgi:hypothetical protein